jgi:Na+/proline symporter
MKKTSAVRKKKRVLPVVAPPPPVIPTPAAPPPPVASESAAGNRNPITDYRWGWYGLSFLIPFAGIFIGLFLYDQDSREDRKVGRTSLFIGFLIWVVFPILVILGVCLVGSIALLSIVTDMIPPMN